MKRKGEYIKIPFPERFKALLGYHKLVFLVALVLIPAAYMTNGAKGALEMLIGITAVWGIPVAVLTWLHRRKFIPKKVLSRDEQEEERQEQIKSFKRQDEIESFILSRYVRWPAAVGLGWIAWEMKDMSAHFTTQTNLAAVSATFMALVAAYDVAIFIVVAAIAIGIIALLAGAASSLTVTGAIIVGAVIIAWAILRSNTNRRDK